MAKFIVSNDLVKSFFERKSDLHILYEDCKKDIYESFHIYRQGQERARLVRGVPCINEEDQCHVDFLNDLILDEVEKRKELNRILYGLFCKKYNNYIYLLSFKFKSNKFIKDLDYVNRVYAQVLEARRKEYWSTYRSDLKSKRKMVRNNTIPKDFKYLPVEESDVVDFNQELYFDEVGDVPSRVFKRIRRHSYDATNIGPQLPWVERVQHRSIMLLYKIKHIIKQYRQTIPPIDFKKYLRDKTKEQAKVEELDQVLWDVDLGAPARPHLVVNAQMDKEGVHGDNEVISDEQTNNVILTTHIGEESVAKPVTISSDNWDIYCSSQKVQEYYDLMTRWQRMGVYRWTKDQPQGTLLSDWTLPLDFVNNCASQPNCLLFKQYAYFRSDMEIKIQVNSNKFHCGALQASFYYGANADKYYNDRIHVACASQMTHALVDAASASDATLIIPYRYYKPLMSTRKIDSDSAVLDIGRFKVLVLNQLRVPTGDTNNVDVTILFRFVNPKFSGMMPRDLGNTPIAQMDSVGTFVKGAERLLNTIYPDDNRDNPTNIQPPIMVYPVNTTSYCIGDQQSRSLQPLRLQADGVTPHPPGTIPAEPEMDLKYLASIYGLVSTTKWDNSQAAGTILLKIPFSPVLDENMCFATIINNGEKRKCEYLPPVSVVAEAFAYWRGGIDYKFDFVSTQFHTGRLIIAYLPRIILTADPTLEQLTSCDHIILDIRDNKQYQFINRFLSDKPWWPRRRQDGLSAETHTPGYIYVAVLNELTATPTVNNFIEFNLYMRGADDLEFQVPVAPQIALSFNTKVDHTNDNTISYDPSYGPPTTSIYVDTWNYVNNAKRLVFRYGPATNHATIFPKTDPMKVYELQGNVTFSAPGYPSLPYLVILPPKFYDTSYYGAPMDTLDNAKKFVASIRLDAATQTYSFDGTLLLESKGASEYYPQGTVYRWKPLDIAIQAQMEDERRETANVISIHPPLQSTRAGLLTFGEKVTDIKQIMRRYQFYTSIQYKKGTGSDPLFADGHFPVMPQGLDLSPTSIAYADNQLRDGIIPIYLSGYRFYRGSVRLKFVMYASSKGTFWVQYKPELLLNTCKLESIETTTKNLSNSFNYLQSGYPYYMQDLSQNSVIEIECPFYLPVQFGMLQRPNLDLIQDACHYALGHVYYGYDVALNERTMNSSFKCNIYYSVGDDFRASVFQGYPAMFRLNMFGPKNKIQAQGLFNWTKGKIVNTVETEIKERVEQMKEEVYSDIMAGDFKSIIEKHFPDITQSRQQTILNILTNIVHAIVNPTLPTFCWALASTFMSLGLITYSYLQACYKSLTSYLMKLIRPRKGRDETVSGPTSENSAERITAQMDDEAQSALVSTLVTGILATLGAKSKPSPRNIPDFARYIYEGSNTFALTSNNLFRFFKNNLTMLKHMWSWATSWMHNSMAFYNELEAKDVEMRHMMTRMMFFLNAANYDTICDDLDLQVELQELANHSTVLLCKIAVCDVARPMPLFIDTMQKILKLRDKMALQFKTIPIKFEPYVLGFIGDSNIGKSFLAQRVAVEMIEAIDYKTNGPIVYDRQPGNCYWNNVKCQPVVLYDDFLCIEESQFALNQIGDLFALKSCSTFNPPKAAVEDKDLIYNPLVVMLLANKPFPHIPGIGTEEAWFRRRDVMWDVQIHSEFVGIHPRHLPEDVSLRFGHLKFRKYCCTRDKRRANEFGPWMDYTEFLQTLITDFQAYIHIECRNYAKLLERFKRKKIDIAKSCEDNIDDIKREMEEYLRSSRKDYAEAKHWERENKKLARMGDLSAYLAGIIAHSKAVDLMQKWTKRCQKVNNKYDQDAQHEKVITDREERIKEQTNLPSTNPNELGYNAQPSTSNDGTIVVAQMNMMEQILSEGDPYAIEVQQDFESNVMQCTICGDCICNFFFDPGAVIVKYDGIDHICSEGKEFMIKPCGSGCVIDHHPEFVSRYFHRLVKKLSMPEHAWPEIIRPIGATAPNDILESERAEEVIKEIGFEEKGFFEKVWEKLPSCRSILTLLTKIIAVVAFIGVCVMGINGLFNIIAGIPTKQKQIQAERKQADTWNYNEDKKREFLESEWQNGNAQKQYAKVLYDIKDEMPCSGSSTTVGKVVKNASIAKILGQASEEQENVILQRILRNTFFLVCEQGSKHRRVRCLGLANRYFINIDHYDNFFRSVSDDSKFYYVSESAQLDIDYMSINFKKANDSALLIGELPKKIPAFKNIIKFIAPRSAINNISPRAKLIETKFDEGSGRFVPIIHAFSRIGTSQMINIDNTDGSVTKVDTCYTYPKSQRGLCGSVLVSEANTPNPLLGIHVAGVEHGSTGYAEVLQRETFECLLHEIVDVEDSVVAEGPLEKAKILVDTNVQLLGTVDRKFVPCLPITSKLVATECAGEINPITYDKPVLHGKDDRIEQYFSPLLEGCRNHGNPPKEFPKEVIQRASDDLKEVILANVKPSRMQVGELTIDEAIVGIPYLQGYEALAFDTSEGYPWILQRPKFAHNKKWLFDLEVDHQGYILKGVDNVLVGRMEEKDRLRANGIVPDTIFMACLKDAKLPIESVLKPGKTRIFSASPVDFTIQQRQLFLDFAVSYQEAKFSAEHGIGMDIKSSDVGEFVRYHLSNSDLLITGDYSKFGDQLMAECVYQVYEIICDWYVFNGDHSLINRRKRMIMCEEVSHAKILVLNLLYRIYSGMPSGNPLTVIINSMVNSLYVRCAWQLIMLRDFPQACSLIEMHRNLRITTYGDDIFLSIKKEFCEIFNCETMSKFFLQYNIKFTDASKSEQVLKYCTIIHPTASFLKHTFQPHPKRKNEWLAALEERSLLEICNWTWKSCKDNRIASIEACTSMLEECYGAGPQYYNALRSRVINYWLNKGERILIPTWQEMDMRIFGI